MSERDAIFLTYDQAKDAICIDLRQYAPQIMLLSNIIDLVTGGQTVVKKDTQKNGAWISVQGQRNMHWLDGPDLCQYVCDLVAETSLSSKMLATICGRVFQSRAYPGVDIKSDVQGIFIETGMEAFACRQCGQCCRSLEYRHEVTAEDVAFWRESGLTDILDHVAVYKRAGQPESYRIWRIPETGQFAQGCPFLQKIPAENRWTCRIQAVKPAICRQYPTTRKHALMTGCRGFGNKSAW